MNRAFWFMSFELNLGRWTFFKRQRRQLQFLVQLTTFSVSDLNHRNLNLVEGELLDMNQWFNPTLYSLSLNWFFFCVSCLVAPEASSTSEATRLEKNWFTRLSPRVKDRVMFKYNCTHGNYASNHLPACTSRQILTAKHIIDIKL